MNDDDNNQAKRQKMTTAILHKGGGGDDAAIARGIQHGNINISTDDAEYMELSEESKLSFQRQEEILKQATIKRNVRTMIVPTNDGVVKSRLRKLGHPICLFGEGAGDRRERLRALMAEAAVEGHDITMDGDEPQQQQQEQQPRQQLKAYNTDGSNELKRVRTKITKWSLKMVKTRLEIERRRRSSEMESLEAFEVRWSTLIRNLKSVYNSSSEIGDIRPLSSCDFSHDSKHLVTASWSGDIKTWNMDTNTNELKLKGHKDRVSDVVFHPRAYINQDPNAVNVVSCGADNLAYIWPLVNDNAMDNEDNIIRPIASLKGHTNRLARIAMHPMNEHVVTTSFDKTWCLWDLETCKRLLTQTGHDQQCYGVAIHCDGALVATSDLGGICLLWDIRTGKVAMPLKAHVKQVLAMDFSENGYHLASASDDHTCRVWDIRKKASVYTIPAHNSLISNVRFQRSNGATPEFLVTSSYDRTWSIWSARDFTKIKTLGGHGDRITRVEIAPNSKIMATVSFDRTWKKWSMEEEEEEDNNDAIIIGNF